MPLSPINTINSKSLQDVTILLNAASAGDETAPDRLLKLVYDDLQRLAAKYMSNERGDRTQQAAALVHEAFLRLADWENISNDQTFLLLYSFTIR